MKSIKIKKWRAEKPSMGDAILLLGKGRIDLIELTEGNYIALDQTSDSLNHQWVSVEAMNNMVRGNKEG